MQTFRKFPRQFWLLFAGFIINRTSGGLIWPFLTIYISRQLDVPLTMVALLLSIQAVAGLISTSIVGPLMDRWGRKRVMIAGLIGISLTLIAMQSAHTLEVWGILIACYGISLPIYNIGGNAMVADVIVPEHRPQAYALIRMGQNIGSSVGPAIGGLLISGFLIGGEWVVLPYGITYFITAAVNITLAVLVTFILVETLPEPKRDHGNQPRGGYGKLLSDRPFVTFWGAYLMIEMVNTMVFMLLSVYIKENYGIPENQFGLLIAINGLMVVFLQFFVTRITVRFRPLPVLAFGALFYAAGALTVAFGREFPAFALSMMIITIGELIVSPTGLSLVARLAPPEMRARYMGTYQLTWTVASGTAPVLGGLLNDHIAPAAIWYGGALLAVIGSIGFLLIARADGRRVADETHAASILQDG
jgi:predicted MFS family arabinose efflux permease